MKTLITLFCSSLACLAQLGDPAFMASLTQPATGSTWTPSSKSGLQLYVAADSGVYSDLGTTPCNADDLVEQWNDQSGNARHCIRTVEANRPQYKANIFGSKPGILFVATSSKSMAVPSAVGSAIAGTDKAFSIAVVVKSTSTNSTRPFISIGGSDPDTLIEANVNAGRYYLLKKDNAGTLVQAVGPANGANLNAHAFVFDGNTTVANIYMDGSLHGSADQAFDAGATTTSTPAYLGFRAGGTTQYFDGYLAVVLVYDSVMDATDISNFTSWAQTNWGTP